MASPLILSHTLGKQIAAVVVVVRSVLESPVQIIAQGPIQDLALRMQINEGDLILGSDLPNLGRIIAECVLDHTALAFHAGDQDRRGAQLTHPGHNGLEIL
jgi:hypothetical protein